MNALSDAALQLEKDGFAVMEAVYSQAVIDRLLHAVSEAGTTGPAYRKTESLFAIRRFLQEVPACMEPVFSNHLRTIVESLFGPGYVAVKSIYFDKPEGSNWFVSYHQDLTISVNRRADVPGFGPWTVKQEQYGVQPPLPILEDNFTIRIHLDDTDENNGALKVMPGSHKRGVVRSGQLEPGTEAEAVCRVQKGGIMLMKPLLLHASGRTLNQQKRRVIHVEFSRSLLPEPLEWAERLVPWTVC